MRFLLDRYRRTALHHYFEELEPIDRLTFWVAAALAFAFGISISALGFHG